ncbi:S8 family peptidase [Kineococcus indalonis]|uniref:S8 family peptidase n=1 Tax=Kineococcus indalonis TaxID=2696566 RepID=UPI001412655E|nr:S8/S53 family peptidase [Kineococcus indalonis]NAZ86571.1 S8 family serine peptidase [Kineococcus indalonis]
MSEGDGDGALDPGSWEGRVAHGPDGSAHRPGRLLVPVGDVDRALELLRALFGVDARQSGAVAGHAVVDGGFDAPRAVTELAAEGIAARLDHVLFADCAPGPGCGCGCPPHPSWCGRGASANPFSSNPFSSNPFSSNPFSSNPFSSNPFSSNPSPRGTPWAATGRRRSSARPAPDPAPEAVARMSVTADGSPVVAVLDTGVAGAALRPAALAACDGDEEVPDADLDAALDPVAGHGTFIAGLLARWAPGCRVRVVHVVQPLGDTDESTVAAALEQLPGTVDFVNLSFGGYAPLDPAGPVAVAVRALQRTPCPAAQRSGSTAPLLEQGTVVVASAGNDATCRPTLPAALPGVVGVGAIGPDGAAPFTNFGPWVRACAPGVDVVSTFFTRFDGTDTAVPDPDRFTGWARWSGTSFSAPTVVARLARTVQTEGCLPSEAVARVVDAPGLGAWPGLGTVVNP